MLTGWFRPNVKHLTRLRPTRLFPGGQFLSVVRVACFASFFFRKVAVCAPRGVASASRGRPPVVSGICVQVQFVSLFVCVLEQPSIHLFIPPAITAGDTLTAVNHFSSSSVINNNNNNNVDPRERGAFMSHLQSVGRVCQVWFNLLDRVGSSGDKEQTLVLLVFSTSFIYPLFVLFWYRLRRVLRGL